MAIIISGFTGIGKTTFAKKSDMKILDIEPNCFKYKKDGAINPRFPKNYIIKIKQSMNKYDYILVSTQPEVISELYKNKFPFFIVAPKKSLKYEYIQRYEQRGSPGDFVKMMRSNWNKFIKQIENYSYPKTFLESGEFLSNIIRPIIIAMTPDNAYARHTATCIRSIIENKSPLDLIKIHIISNDFSPRNKAKILSMKSNNVDIVFNKITTKIFKNFYLQSRFPVNVYFRLALADIFLNYDKILYLDVDTLVLTSLAQIYNIDISNFALAGVKARNYASSMDRVGIPDNGKYINAGVLLINLKFWRHNKVFQKCTKYLKTHKPHYLDQDTTNVVLQDHIKYISPVWNVSSFPATLTAPGGYKEMYDALQKPKILHLITSEKPWLATVKKHPHRKIYFKYLKKTPYWYYKWKYMFERFIYFRDFSHSKYFLRILGINVLNSLHGITYLFGFRIKGKMDAGWKKLLDFEKSKK